MRPDQRRIIARVDQLISLCDELEAGLLRSQADSDVDIFIVCKGEKSKLEDKLTDLTNISQNKFGNPVSLLIKHREELQDLKTRSIFRKIKNGEIIFKEEGFEW